VVDVATVDWAVTVPLDPCGSTVDDAGMASAVAAVAPDPVGVDARTALGARPTAAPSTVRTMAAVSATRVSRVVR
jgi:hypothetical protein